MLTSVMMWGLNILFAVMVPALLLPSFFAFDAFVRREHDFHAQAWNADGRPHGVFWRPPGSGSSWGVFSFDWAAGRATNRCAWKWLFTTPSWVRDDDEALRLLTRMRRLVLAWNLGLIVFAFVVMGLRTHAR